MAFEAGPQVATVAVPVLGERTISGVQAGIIACLPVFLFKQLTNVLQMFIAFGAINEYDGAAKSSKSS